MRQLALIFFLVCSIGFSQEKASKSSIIKLLELNQTSQMVSQTIDRMIGTMNAASQDPVQTEFFEKFKSKMTADRYMDIYIEIYQKHFSESEILQLIEFYKTPMGQNLIEKLPLIQQEAYDAGTKLGMEISQEVLNEMQVEN